MRGGWETRIFFRLRDYGAEEPGGGEVEEGGRDRGDVGEGLGSNAGDGRCFVML